MFGWTDISDHKGGVILLLAVALATSGLNWLGRLTAVKAGGAKRLQALSKLAGAVLLLPWALYHHQELVEPLIIAFIAPLSKMTCLFSRAFSRTQRSFGYAPGTVE